MVPYIDKDDPTVIAYRINPPGQAYPLPYMRFPQFSAIVRSVPDHKTASDYKKNPSKTKCF
jgi:hypothetical protein